MVSSVLSIETLADLKSYGEALETGGPALRRPQRLGGQSDPDVAACGKFSSGRTIADYAREIRQAAPCPIS
jgi:glucan phosphorylase